MLHIHQIQVLELVEIVAVGDAGYQTDDFIADVINEHLVVQHFVGQQVDGVLVGDLHLTVVDVVRNVRRATAVMASPVTSSALSSTGQ